MDTAPGKRQTNPWTTIWFLPSLNPVFTKKLDFSSNTLVVIPKNILHDEKHFVESKLTAIGFSPDESDKQLFGKNAFDEPFLYHDNHNKIQNIISKIEQEYSRRTPYSKEMIRLLLAETIASIFSPQSATVADEMIDFTIAYIDEHFTTKISIEEIAAQTYYSTDHFRVLFEQKVGKSPKAYILDKRLEYSKQLISKTNLSLSEISALCGFTDYIQFNKFFKKKEKITPSEFAGKRNSAKNP